jgi:transposase-like protein
MKTTKGFARRPRTSLARRTQLLAKFERSGLSAAAFARRHGLHYTTFCGWRQRQAKAETGPGFVQVELPAPDPPAGLVIELGPWVRMRLTDASSIALAAQLLQAVCAPRSC